MHSHAFDTRGGFADSRFLVTDGDICSWDGVDGLIRYWRRNIRVCSCKYEYQETRDREEGHSQFHTLCWCIYHRLDGFDLGKDGISCVSFFANIGGAGASWLNVCLYAPTLRFSRIISRHSINYRSHFAIRDDLDPPIDYKTFQSNGVNSWTEPVSLPPFQIDNFSHNSRIQNNIHGLMLAIQKKILQFRSVKWK